MNKIYSFVGPFGVGKTTKLKQIEQICGNELVYIYEDDSLLEFLKQNSLYFRQIGCVTILWYKLLEAMKECKDIVTDCHPMNAMIYAFAFFELENGIGLNMKDILLIQSYHLNVFRHFQSRLSNYEQIVYYVNIPFEDNFRNVLRRDREEFGENDEEYLKCVRRNFNQHLRPLAETLYGAEVREITTLHDLTRLSLDGKSIGP